MAVADHPNKEIRAAVAYAEQQGWRVVKSSARAHVWGQLFCPHAARGGYFIRVFSTPRSAENHANRIRREIDKCPHG